MKLKKILLNSLLTFMVTASAAAQEDIFKPSPWDHGQKELKKSVTHTPFHYQKLFDRERELYGYNPRFMPGNITFMKDNTPVIRFGVQGKIGSHKTSYKGRKFTELNYIQKLGKNGKWYITDSHMKSLRKYLKLKQKDSLLVMSGERVPETVEFDHHDNAYTLVTARIKDDRFNSNFLLYSHNGMKNWQVYPLIEPRRIEPAFLNYWRKGNDLPPVILAKKKNTLGIYVLSRKADNTLNISPYIVLAKGKKLLFQNSMSGVGSPLITLCGKTFLVYSKLEKHPNSDGVPQYIVSYDHKSGKVSKTISLGYSGHRVDGHNASVIAADSKNYLHVVLGTHWHSMPYLKSKKPADCNSWQPREYVGAGASNAYSFDGLSYPGFMVDKKDNLHLVVRGRSTKYEGLPTGRGNPVDYALIAFRKEPGKPWSKRQDLVVPGHLNYSNYYQKISMNRLGRIYLAYYYYTAHFWRRNRVNASMREYVKRWGDEVGNDPRNIKCENDVRAHDPVLIDSPDNGKRWQISTTREFLNQMQKKDSI